MLLSDVYHGICPCFGFFTPDYGGLEYYTFFGEYAEGLADRYKIKRGEVEFVNVSFRYGNGENDVLRNVNFHIRPAETVAVVGATGAAKSSMVQLFPDFMMLRGENFASMVYL